MKKRKSGSKYINQLIHIIDMRYRDLKRSRDANIDLLTWYEDEQDDQSSDENFSRERSHSRDEEGSQRRRRWRCREHVFEWRRQRNEEMGKMRQKDDVIDSKMKRGWRWKRWWRDFKSKIDMRYKGFKKISWRQYRSSNMLCQKRTTSRYRQWLLKTEHQ